LRNTPIRDGEVLGFHTQERHTSAEKGQITREHPSAYIVRAVLDDGRIHTGWYFHVEYIFDDLIPEQKYGIALDCVRNQYTWHRVLPLSSIYLPLSRPFMVLLRKPALPVPRKKSLHPKIHFVNP
jgi:hypothetical protein